MKKGIVAKELLVALIILTLVAAGCFFLCGCKKEANESKYIKVIPTVVNSESGEIWASDVYIRPEDITEDIGIVYMEEGTKLGEWAAPVDGFYQYEQIKEYLENL